MPGTKIYVINSVELITATQRYPKTLAFPPIEAKMGIRLNAASEAANQIIMKNVNGDDGDWGLSMDTYKCMRTAMTPGSNLDSMNRVMIQEVAAFMEKLHTVRSSPSPTIGLMEWLRHEITLATTNAVYGPMNPYVDKNVENGFWDLVHDLTMILLNIVPSITARKGIRGRETVGVAFLKYFNANGQQDGSKFVQNRYDVSIRNGVSVMDTAKFEVGGGIAMLVNTTPTVFWLLFHVYSCPDILQDLRRELATIMTVTEDDSGLPVRTLDIIGVKTHCPLLTSTFQEVLRHRSVSTSVRQVMEDTMLDGKYLLKKDAILQMPSLVIHTDTEIWGSDVETFNHRRFMTDKAKKSSEIKRIPAGAFRAFGGGSTLCPGRHFATTGILAIVVGFIMRYELTPEAGCWSSPTHAKTNIAAAVMEPDYDLSVKVEPRAGFEDGTWAFKLADSEIVFAVAAEDLDT
ncbi:hypothetical protein MMC27_002740 [Xylographa pallens]|nr:hypothetical protein [Xylographa pallens]